MTDEANAQVDAFIAALKFRYGLSDHDITGMLTQMADHYKEILLNAPFFGMIVGA